MSWDKNKIPDPPKIEDRTDITPEDEDLFVDWVTRRRSVNFVKACKDLGLDFGAVDAKIAEHGAFYDKLSLALKKLKMMLIGDTFDACLKGDPKSAPAISHLRWIIDLIDSGALLGDGDGGVGGGGKVLSESEVEEETDPFSL